MNTFCRNSCTNPHRCEQEELLKMLDRVEALKARIPWPVDDLDLDHDIDVCLMEFDRLVHEVYDAVKYDTCLREEIESLHDELAAKIKEGVNQMVPGDAL